jgi:hypothetical protein
MRVDRVRNLEVHIRHYQTLVNQKFSKGISKNEIQEFLNDREIKIRTDNDSDYDTFKPRVCVRLSHLGKGYIAFFHCLRCNAHVRMLYLLNKHLWCRMCHGLTYKKQQIHDVIVRRIATNEQYRNRYSYGQSSLELMQATLIGSHRAMKVIEADILNKKIRDRGYQKADEIIKFYERYHKYRKNELNKNYDYNLKND